MNHTVTFTGLTAEQWKLFKIKCIEKNLKIHERLAQMIKKEIEEKKP